MYKVFFIVNFVISLSCTCALAGPNKNSLFKKFADKGSLRLQVFNQAIGMPPHFFNGRLHPGIEVGIQAPFKRNAPKSFFDYAVSLGYFSQQELQRVGFLKLGAGYVFKVVRGFSLRPSLHLAGFYVSQINDEFVYKGNGIYETYKGKRVQAKPGLGIDAISPSMKLKSIQLSLIAGYEFGLQLPFSLLSSTLPLNQLHVGILLKK